jgi:hypothetical protein
MKIKKITVDLYKCVKNVFYIKNVFTASNSSDPVWRKNFGEFETLANTVPKFTKTVFNLLTGELSKNNELILKDVDGDEHWFYINGIMTSKEVAAYNELALENIFGKEFHTLYNPTNGFAADMLEVFYERTLDNIAPITRQLFDIIDELIYNDKKVRIISYSQGGIITNNFLKMIAKHSKCGKKYSNLEIYTFGGAADEEVLVKGVYQEHFGNEKDFVARIGLMFENTQSKYYTLNNAVGHLLNQDYLEHFKAGRYCNGKSKLFSYTQ